MKKIFATFMTIAAFATITTISSCTKEEVKPTNTIGNNSGGTPSSDPIKD